MDEQPEGKWISFATQRPTCPTGFRRTAVVRYMDYVTFASVIGTEIRMVYPEGQSELYQEVFKYGDRIEYWMWIPDHPDDSSQRITKEHWLKEFRELEADIKVNVTSVFQLVFEPNEFTGFGDVWLQTAEAEDDSLGYSCRLPNVQTVGDLKKLKRLLKS